jgi:hypothetical protein
MSAYGRDTYGRLNMENGFTEDVFKAIESNGSKMNVGLAAKFFSTKHQRIQESNIQSSLSKESLTLEDVVMIRGINAFSPHTVLINDVFDVFNGINVNASKNCEGKNKVLERLTYLDKRQLLLIRSTGRMFDDGARDIVRAMEVQSNEITNVMPPKKKKKITRNKQNNPINEKITLHKNYFSYQTQIMASSTCYSIASFLVGYHAHRPNCSVNLRNLNSDCIEQHFSVFKYFCKGEVTVNRIRHAEARAATHRAIEARKYVARGFKYPPKYKRNRLSAEKVVVYGNCEPDTDNGENEMKKINRTHAVKRNDMNSPSNMNSYMNTSLYKDANLSNYMKKK